MGADEVAGNDITDGVIIIQEVGNYSSLTADRQKAYKNAVARYISTHYDSSNNEYCVGSIGFLYNRVYNGVDYGGVTDLANLTIEEDYIVSNANSAFYVAADRATPNTSSIIAG